MLPVCDCFFIRPTVRDVDRDGYGLRGVCIGCFYQFLEMFLGVLTESDCNFWLTTSNRIGSIKLKNLRGSVLCENRLAKIFHCLFSKHWPLEMYAEGSYHWVEMPSVISPEHGLYPMMFAFDFRGSLLDYLTWFTFIFTRCIWCCNDIGVVLIAFAVFNLIPSNEE